MHVISIDVELSPGCRELKHHIFPVSLQSDDFMTSKRQRLQPFHDVGPVVSSSYNPTIHNYSEKNLGDKNFSLTQATPYNSDHLISDHSLLHTTDDGALCSTSLQANCSISNNSTSSSIA
ncbi:hypothetical protein NC652_022080 [Populus alba x Populus x berolinensis]|nr:hypothetical protein NC652_022080 [Populus alba x Populus x berolinensis]